MIVEEFSFSGHVLRLHQNNETLNHGTTVWDSSKLLARFFEKNRRTYNRRKLEGKRVLELGSGCGLSGMCMALLGCNVDFTDRASVISILQANVAQNLSGSMEPARQSKSSVHVHEWGGCTNNLNPPYDFIVGSDVVFKSEPMHLLFKSILALASRKTMVILANEWRDTEIEGEFHQILEDHFQWKRTPSARIDSAFGERMFVYAMTKKTKFQDLPTSDNRLVSHINDTLCIE